MIIPRQKLVDSSKYSLKCPYPMDGEFFVVHNTDNDASANNEISYMINNTSSTSFHYAVDDIEIVQGIRTDRNSWNAGDGKEGIGNRKGISVEICYSQSGGERFDKAEVLAAKFIAQELVARKWDTSKVNPHQKFSGKYCPQRTLDRGWQRFIDMIQKEINALTPPEPPTIWYRVLIDGVNIEANRTLEESETIVRTKINNGEGKLGQVQRNTDGVILYTYSKPVVIPPPVVVEPPKKSEEPKHAIMDNAEILVEQAEQFLHKENPQAPYFAQIYKEEGEFEGVRWDIAFAQSIKETGYFRFGGDVPGLQNNNFCGLGATGDGVQGAVFSTPQEGIRAQIQHLKGYATTEPLKKPCVDPRYDILKRNSMLGIAPNVEDLNDRWAAKDFTYGQEIVKLVEKMKAEVVVPKEEPKQEEVKENIIDKIIKGFINIIDWLFS